MQPWAKAFYHSKEWQRCRYGFIQSVNGVCNRCGDPGKIVHHKETLTPENITDPFVSLNWDMLELLCQTCHNQEHSRSKPTRDDVMFDANGDLVAIAPPKKRGVFYTP